MKTYIAIDGDGVGTRLGELVQGGYPDAVIAAFAGGVASEMKKFSARAKEHGAYIILCSGDSVLLSCEGNKISAILSGLTQCKLCTYSAGTGRTAREAALSLQYAKMNGKAQTWHYQSAKPFWLRLRIEIFPGLSKYAAGHF